MIEGLHRSNVPYLWPPSLLFDASGRRSIYLDLNHWIGLAKANSGHEGGRRYAALLEAAKHAVESHEVVFPLSGQHYMEMYGIRDPRQRQDIATVMLELSEIQDADLPVVGDEARA